jgi:carboxyl-terminal processing protease
VLALTLYALGFMEDWADEYMRKHHARSIDVRTFTITDEEYDDFKRFIAERDVPYESETRLALKSLERAMENDLYDERMGEALENLRSLLSDDKMSNMETYREEINDALTIEIILRYAYREGVAEHAMVHDKEVDKAVELLLNQEEYNRILREQDLNMH